MLPSLFAFLITNPVTAFLFPSQGTFELDGDATTNFTNDWDSITMDSSSFHHDGIGSTIFTSGGSKDPQDIDSWLWKEGSVPDKDELLNIYAATEVINGELLLYFGADRYDNSGDAAVGFWFLQDQDVGLTNDPQGGGFQFSGLHKNDDLFVITEFSNGGSTPMVRVFRWYMPQNPPNNYNPLIEVTTVEARCGDELEDVYACSISNAQATNSPWDFVPKSGDIGVFGPGMFIEGGVNLHWVYGEEIPCFTSMLAETRSSTSDTSTLKDFAFSGFETCNLNASLTCGESRLVDGNQIEYEVLVSVVNDGFGGLGSVEYKLGDDGEWINMGYLGTGESFSDDVTLLVNEQLVLIGPLYVQANATVVMLNATVEGIKCDSPIPHPSVQVTKQCDVLVRDFDVDYLETYVVFNGTVTNNGDIDLSGVMMSDVVGCGDVTFASSELGELRVGETLSFSGTVEGCETVMSAQVHIDNVTAIGSLVLGYDDVNAVGWAVAECVGPVIDLGIDVVHECDVSLQLNDAEDAVELVACERINVTNTGNVKLVGIELETSDSVFVELGTLEAGEKTSLNSCDLLFDVEGKFDGYALVIGWNPFASMPVEDLSVSDFANSTCSLCV